MQMRLFHSLAFSTIMLLTQQIKAQEVGTDVPSREESIAVRAFVGSAFADRHCAGYQINQPNALAVLTKSHIEPKDIFIRFNQYTVAFSLMLNKEYDGHPAEFCDFLVQAYGANGQVPNLIEHR